jgi:Transglycosylase SLT domain
MWKLFRRHWLTEPLPDGDPLGGSVGAGQFERSVERNLADSHRFECPVNTAHAVAPQLFKCGEDGGIVDGTQRMPPPVGGDWCCDLSIMHAAQIQQIRHTLSGNIGHVAGDDQIPLRGGSLEYGDDASQRPLSRVKIFDNGERQMGEKILGPDYGCGTGCGDDLLSNMFYECGSLEIKESFSGAHAPAGASGQHKSGRFCIGAKSQEPASGRGHERIITLHSERKAYTQQIIAAIIIKNRGMQICFKAVPCLAAAVIATLAQSSVLTAASRQPHVRSVVRADSKTGRLIRSYVVTGGVTQKPSAARPQTVDTSTAPGMDASVPQIIDEMAKKYDVDPLLVHSMIQVESAYNPYAVSPKGAQGLMQLMPATARRFGVANSFDVRDNIEGGVRYLKYLDSLFPDDLRLKLAAYNAGEGAVWKYNNKIPPYPETQQYVYKVGLRFEKALKEAEGKAAQKQELSADTPAITAEVYAPIISHVDAEGRLHLRTAERSRAEGNDSVRTP